VPQTQHSSKTYDIVAAEYYDPDRHPTCANFREASLIAFHGWLQKVVDDSVLYVDVGCGDSVMAEALERLGRQPPMALVDGSERMLKHSAHWSRKGVRLLVAPSEALPFEDGTAGVLTCSLGDPFNTPAFWSEVSRVLPAGGRALYTTPSFEWAQSFRRQSPLDASEFILRDGSNVDLPSYIYPVADQIALIERHGLRVQAVQGIPRSEIKGRLSPKITFGTQDLPVVSGFSLSK
jgi:hypothetical protein